MRQPYLTLWILWIAAFFAIEIPAALNPAKGDTFSELLWKITAHPLPWYLAAAAIVWFAVHVLSGGRWA